MLLAIAAMLRALLTLTYESVSVSVSPMMTRQTYLNSIYGSHCRGTVFSEYVWYVQRELYYCVPVGSASRGGDVAVYVSDISQPSLQTLLFYFVLYQFMSVSIFMAPFNCISFHKFSWQLATSHSVLPALFLPNWSFQLYLFESLLLPWYKSLWLTGLKAPTTVLLQRSNFPWETEMTFSLKSHV